MGVTEPPLATMGVACGHPQWVGVARKPPPWAAGGRKSPPEPPCGPPQWVQDGKQMLSVGSRWFVSHLYWLGVAMGYGWS
jgi:hypothetical protein